MKLWISFTICVLTVTPLLASSDAYYDYMQGLMEERAGNTSKALIAYQKVVQQDPNALEVYRDIAQLQLRLGHGAEAVAAAEKVKELSPKDPESFLFLGNVYVAQGNLAKAADAYEQVLVLDPKNLQALQNLGNYYAILDPDKGLTYFQRYLAIDSNDPEIYFQMALAYQKAGNGPKSVELFQKASELEPEQPAPHLALAAVYETKGSTVAAIAEYELAVKAQPQNPMIYMRLGRLYYDSQQWDEAASAFENAKSLQAKDSTVYYWLARVAEEQQRWKDAAAFAQEAYRISQDPQFLPLLAYYLTLDHRPAEAIPWLEKVRKADPSNANALLFLGMNYLELDKPVQAQEALAHGVAVAPNDVQMRFQLGVAEDRLNHFDAAVPQFQAVLAADPKNAPSMNYLGFSWADRGIRLEEAETLLRQAVALDPENGAYLDSLGWVRFKRGDRAEAITFLQKAVLASPDPQIYDHLGDVFLADQQVDAAHDAWMKALAMDPKNAAIRKKADEAASRVSVGTDQRKYLKYIEGNNLQIHTLQGTVAINARWKGHPIKTLGKILYQKPDQLVLEIPGPSSTPIARVLIDGTTVQIEPPTAAQSLQEFPMQGLVSLPAFFSGQLTAPLDSPAVKTQMEKKIIHYVADSREAWIDTERGVLTQFQETLPNEGRYNIEIRSYVFVDGLWLPSEMRLSNDSQKWKARLLFSDWAINGAHP